jgi:Fic family protein
MVQIPDKAPDWHSIIKKNFKSVFSFPQNSDIQSLIEKSDKRYYYWDKIRAQPIPNEFNREEVWAYIRFRRYMNSSPTPITDVKGKPFTFWQTDYIQKNLHLIDQNISGNLALYEPGENERRASARYVLSSLMEEAITSSQIEGAVATIKDAKKMLLAQRKPKTKSEQMIYNNYSTMQSIKELRKKELSLQLLLDLHISITKDTLDTKEEEGKLRTSKDDVTIVTSYGDVLFTPPDASEVKDRLEALCRFANDGSDRPFIHPIIKAIMLHFWMAYIHPFTDGNGRVARTLFYWYLLKHEYWLFEYTSISKTILKKTAKYANAYLYSEHDDNDLTYFINFHVDIIMEAVEELKTHMQEEREKNHRARLAISEHPDLNLRQTRIIQHVMVNPNDYLTIKIHQKLCNIAYQTARTDLLELAEKGWLKSIQKGNKFYFVPAETLWEKIQKEDL